MYRQASRHFTNIKIGHYDRQGVPGSRKQAITEVLFPIGGLFRETYEKPAYVVCTPTGPLNVSYRTDGMSKEAGPFPETGDKIMDNGVHREDSG